MGGGRGHNGRPVCKRCMTPPLSKMGHEQNPQQENASNTMENPHPGDANNLSPSPFQGRSVTAAHASTHPSTASTPRNIKALARKRQVVRKAVMMDRATSIIIDCDRDSKAACKHTWVGWVRELGERVVGAWAGAWAGG